MMMARLEGEVRARSCFAMAADESAHPKIQKATTDLFLSVRKYNKPLLNNINDQTVIILPSTLAYDVPALPLLWVRYT